MFVVFIGSDHPQQEVNEADEERRRRCPGAHPPMTKQVSQSLRLLQLEPTTDNNSTLYPSCERRIKRFQTLKMTLVKFFSSRLVIFEVMFSIVALHQLI